jgi:hypothetical protein
VIWFYLPLGLSIVALILAAIVMTLIWERNRVFRQAQQQRDTPSI